MVLHLNHDKDIQIGKLGKLFFKKGTYLYIGSAMGKVGSVTLENRVRRHLRSPKLKNNHWHIDFLLENKEINLIKLFLIPNKKNLECILAQELLNLSDGFIKKFGSSDCSCKSHLLLFEDTEDFEIVEFLKIRNVK